METKKPSARVAHTPAETAASRASASRSMPAVSSTFATTADFAAGLTTRQQNILEARGINVELAMRLGWRAKPGGTGEIEIPFFRSGIEVNCKTRTIEGEKRFHQVSGGEKCFYNVDALVELGDETLVITEGEMDCLIALQCGFVAVSVPDGAPKEAIGDRDSVKYDYLRDVPQSVKRIIQDVDSDARRSQPVERPRLPTQVYHLKGMWREGGPHRPSALASNDSNDAFLAYQEWMNVRGASRCSPA